MSNSSGETLALLEGIAVRLLQAQSSETAELTELRELLRQAAEGANDALTVVIRTACDQLTALLKGNASDPEALLSDVVHLVCEATSPADLIKAPKPVVITTAPPAKSALPSLLPTEVDLELATDFLVEANDHVGNAEAALLVLEENPEDKAAVDTVFRAFHTVKGVAAMLGMTALAELAHHAESLLAKIRSGQLKCVGTNANLCLRATDLLKETLIAVSCQLKGQPARLPDDYSSVVSALKHTAEGDASAAVTPQPAPLSPIKKLTVAPAPVSIHPTSPAAASVAPRARQSAAPKKRSVTPPRAKKSIKPESAPGGDAHEHGPPTADQGKVPAAASADENSVRVRTDRLDRLVDMVGELVIAHSMLAQTPTDSNLPRDPDLHRKVAHAGKIVRSLQELSMSLRMVPLRTTVQKLTRIVRDVAKKRGKQIHFTSSGEDTEIDRLMVDLIAEPLIHMVRNAADHGIETPEERVAAGKPKHGTITVAAYRAGSNVVIDLKDDGAGLNSERILKKAIEQGIVEPNKTLSEAEIFQLIFKPGFSTAQVVTDISGRGVGMDVVRQSIERLKGGIDITSKKGKGTTFSIRLPLTLAITDGMLVRTGRERYIIPTVNIHLNFRPEPSQVSTVTGRGEVVLLRGELVPLYRLHRLFDIRGAEENPSRGLVVILRHGTHVCGLLVDELLGQQQVVAKTLGEEMGQLPAISGGAILGDGRVGLIIDPENLFALAREVEAKPLAKRSSQSEDVRKVAHA